MNKTNLILVSLCVLGYFYNNLNVNVEPLKIEVPAPIEHIVFTEGLNIVGEVKGQ